ncbi:hypothetical protein RKLH11_261 [Rhodobacteraceae bacterium KLH11]|nr:hypothetical protein RKLH11_261 [Rhodobacteraceae bacterium KLH11]
MMGKVESKELQWFACRVKRKQVGGIRTITVGGEFKAYRDRAGRACKRRVNGTGDRVFLPEYILRRAGFEVFLPIKKVLRRKNRYTPEKALISQPLLVDWLFVGWPVGESRWHDLMELDVISGVMGTGGHPIEFPAARVMSLMRQWGGGHLSSECRRYLKTGSEFAVGDTARVIAGPLDGVHVRVVDVSGPTVKAALGMLGSEVVTEIRGDLLEVIKGANVKP